MTDLSKPTQIIELAIASSQAFSAIYPEFISQYSLPSNASKDYIKDFLDSIHRILFSKSSRPIQKFYAMYLLFKASEREDRARLMSQLVENNELLSEIFRIAQTDLCKDILPNERGRTYFWKPHSQDHLHIGMNLVRLCYEAAVYWGSKYAETDAKNPMHIYFFLADTLKKKGKQPFRYFFIGRDYDLSAGIATWDFRNDLPPQNKPKKDKEECVKISDSPNTSLDDIENIDEGDQDGMFLRLGGKNNRSNDRKSTKSVPLIIKSHKEDQKAEHIKTRVARLEAVLHSLKNNNQINANKTTSLDDLDNSVNTHQEEINNSQGITINPQESDMGQFKYSRNNSSNMENKLEEREKLKDLKKAKEIEKELIEIQMSITNSCGIKKKLNPFCNSSGKRSKYPSSLQALPSENRTKDIVDERKLKEEYEKFMDLRLNKLVTFGEEVTGSGLFNSNPSKVKTQQSMKTNPTLERVCSFGPIDMGVLRLESKDSIMLPSIEEGKQCDSLVLPGEEHKARKYDPFSKAPIPNQRIPDNYQITQVVVETQGKARKSTVASREFTQNKQSYGSLNELRSESEAIRPTQGLRIHITDRAIHSLPNLDRKVNTERKRIEIIKPFYGSEEKSQTPNQPNLQITKGI